MTHSSSSWTFTETHAANLGKAGQDFQAHLGRTLIRKADEARARLDAPPEVLTRTVNGATLIQRRFQR